MYQATPWGIKVCSSEREILEGVACKRGEEILVRLLHFELASDRWPLESKTTNKKHTQRQKRWPKGPSDSLQVQVSTSGHPSHLWQQLHCVQCVTGVARPCIYSQGIPRLCTHTQTDTHTHTQRHTHRDTHTHTETHTHTQRHTHTHRGTQTETHTERHTHTHTQSHAHRDTQTHRHTDTQTHRHTDTQTHRHTHTHTQRHTHTHRDTHTETHTERHTHRDTHTDTHRDTHTETHAETHTRHTQGHTQRHTQRHTHTTTHTHTEGEKGTPLEAWTLDLRWPREKIGPFLQILKGTPSNEKNKSATGGLS